MRLKIALKISIFTVTAQRGGHIQKISHSTLLIMKYFRNLLGFAIALTALPFLSPSANSTTTPSKTTVDQQPDISDNDQIPGDQSQTTNPEFGDGSGRGSRRRP